MAVVNVGDWNCTVTYKADPCCGYVSAIRVPSLDEQIAEAEKRAAELKAEKAKRDAEAEAKKTVGQRMAEQMVVAGCGDDEVRHTDLNGQYWPFRTVLRDDAVKCMRGHVAAAIDKAVAEQREADAKIAEGHQRRYETAFDRDKDYPRGGAASAAFIADDIRKQK